MAIVRLKVEGFNPPQKEGDKEGREVLLVTYTFNRAVDAKGQTTGNPQGGLVTVQVKALTKGFEPELLSWLIQKENKKGSVEFYDDDGNFIKALEFENAFCIKFMEDFEENKGWMEEIVITCEKLKLKQVGYVADWR